MEITFKILFELPFLKLVQLAMMDDLVLFLRLWPIWVILIFIVMIIIAKDAIILLLRNKLRRK